MKRILIALVKAYRLMLSPWLGNGCRFHPTCWVRRRLQSRARSSTAPLEAGRTG